MPASMPAGDTGLASGTRAMRKPAPVSITCSPSEATFSMTSYRGKRLNVQVSHPNRQPIFLAAGVPRAPGAAASGRGPQGQARAVARAAVFKKLRRSMEVSLESALLAHVVDFRQPVVDHDAILEIGSRC